MLQSYEAILNGDRLEWTGEAPNTATPVRVRVTLVQSVLDETPQERAARGKRLGEALRALAELNPFRDIEDPVAWQREIRRDRPLPGRDE